jgi:hypothetical protein
MKFWFRIRVSNIYVSNELSRAVPVYYDLKEYGLGTWFWSFRKLDLTKVKIMDWLSAHANRSKGKLEFIWKLVAFAKNIK